jgi:hypothetical protein
VRTEGLSSFEQQKWSTIEVEAMNEYVKNMPIYSIQQTLKNAMEAITREWTRGLHIDGQQITTSPVANCDPINESMNFQPNTEISDISTAKSPDTGIQMLLDAVFAEGYGAMDNGATPLHSTSQDLESIQREVSQLTNGPEGEQTKDVECL